MVSNKNINWIYDHIQDCYKQANGLEKSILRDILGLFESAPDNVVLLNTDGLSDDDIFRLVHQASRNALLLPGGSCEPSIELVEPERWIPVTERLPAEDERVLVWLGAGDITYTQIDTDRLHKGKWRRWSRNVTHWMPLPDPPQEVE